MAAAESTKKKSGWLARILSDEAAADRADERAKKASAREQKRKDAEAKRRLKLEKQAAQNRRYDAVTQIRKERGGAGLSIVFAHRDSPPEGRSRKKAVRTDSRKAVDAMKRSLRSQYSGSTESRNRAYAADVDAQRGGRPVKDLPQSQQRSAVEKATIEGGLGAVYYDDQYAWMYKHGMAKTPPGKVDRSSEEYLATVRRYEKLAGRAGYEIYSESQKGKKSKRRP
ncbi:MAG: hypothetical protein LKJ94_07280 [Candidatus Methanomethylophilus sp.]|jgi:hypothetical protein|nr:hypothetical protein [Methanomethylophilus sp.]MCI2075473.1 hypothetical protein [Methanomethylophilus sp.]MCI2093295.1 hypothetical protein [Methanomethylophilus sp.]WII08835.1 hypothetical protein O8W32_06580 [Methanomassiliicoccales archaeon LGM-DZ1]